VNRVETRAIASDLIVATGGLGGPVFNAAGDLVGITSLPDGRDERSEESRIVRVADACAVIAAAIAKSTGAPAPDSPRLPVEPTTATPSVDTLKEAAKRRAGSLKPYQLTSFDFDVGFMTPVLTYYAQSQPNQDFSNWSEYVSDNPPVLFIRVTPRMAENFWAKVARGAAQTQGMALPPIKRMRSGFLRLHAFCGAAEVTPIHPFKLERRVAEAEAIFEGLYVFDPAALGPACGTVKLVLHSEKEPGKADTRVVDPVILRQIWRDFGLDAGR
jgi:hypothetical protein